VDRIGAPESFFADGSGKNCVIGRMKDAVAKTREYRQDEEHPIAVDETHQHDRRGNQTETPQQNPAGSQVVDEKSDRRLQNTAEEPVGGHGETQFNIGDTEFHFQ